jgi:hypothetical protein
VSGSITDITALKEVEHALRRRDQILDALTYASQELLSPEGLEALLPNVLAQLSQAIGFERAYILKRNELNDGSARPSCIPPGRLHAHNRNLPGHDRYDNSLAIWDARCMQAGTPISEVRSAFERKRGLF